MPTSQTELVEQPLLNSNPSTEVENVDTLSFKHLNWLWNQKHWKTCGGTEKQCWVGSSTAMCVQCHTCAKMPGQSERKDAGFIWHYGNSQTLAGEAQKPSVQTTPFPIETILCLSCIYQQASALSLLPALQEAEPADTKLKPPGQRLALLNFISQILYQQLTHSQEPQAENCMWLEAATVHSTCYGTTLLSFLHRKQVLVIQST